MPTPIQPYKIKKHWVDRIMDWFFTLWFCFSLTVFILDQLDVLKNTETPYGIVFVGMLIVIAWSVWFKE